MFPATQLVQLQRKTFCKNFGWISWLMGLVNQFSSELIYKNEAGRAIFLSNIELEMCKTCISIQTILKY